jgi:hypothetical protein
LCANVAVADEAHLRRARTKSLFNLARQSDGAVLYMPLGNNCISVFVIRKTITFA